MSTTTDSAAVEPAAQPVEPVDGVGADGAGVNDLDSYDRNDEDLPPIQPDRYVEHEAHIPDPTAQYGIPLTRGNVPTVESLEYATPLFRDHRLAVEGVDPEEVTDDQYYLTPSQLDAAREITDGTSAADLGMQKPSDTSAITGLTNPAAASALAASRRHQQENADGSDEDADDEGVDNDTTTQTTTTTDTTTNTKKR